MLGGALAARRSRRRLAGMPCMSSCHLSVARRHRLHARPAGAAVGHRDTGPALDPRVWHAERGPVAGAILAAAPRAGLACNWQPRPEAPRAPIPAAQAEGLVPYLVAAIIAVPQEALRVRLGRRGCRATGARQQEQREEGQAAHLRAAHGGKAVDDNLKSATCADGLAKLRFDSTRVAWQLESAT